MKRIGIIMLFLLGTVGLGSIPPQIAQAGVYDENTETTYKEYWIDHKEFTGGCNDDGTPSSPNGSWYAEPYPKCPKTMNFTLPDGLDNVVKAEIYLDLWRNRNNPGVRFTLNGASTEYHPNAGGDWSRTPWAGEVAVNELQQGNNQIHFTSTAQIHIHDVAIRLYYDENNPLTPGGGSDVTPPDGELLTITADNGSFTPNQGGLLRIDSDQLQLSAQVSEAKFVEFHAYYEGYDVDNDGKTTDWHHSTRNNWHPGGREYTGQPTKTGGTINHIGTVDVVNGTANVTWDLKHIWNQSGVKFKIRVVDAAGNVRDAAGGVSAAFSLVRNNPIIAFTVPNFTDFGLHMNGQRPDSVQYFFDIPASVNLADYQVAYLVGNYWRRPQFSINDLSPSSAYSSSDDWAMSVKTFNKNALNNGQNRITYLYSGSGTGHFIEKPGPMIVLKRTAPSPPDTAGPVVASRSPAPNATNVDRHAPVVLRLSDNTVGIDKSSIVMTVNGAKVNPQITGHSLDYTLTFTPAQAYPFLANITVTLYGCDLLGNCMPSADVYTFKVEDVDTVPPLISNVSVTASYDSAVIKWQTNENASSKLAYGKTAAYELGDVTDAALKTSHSLQLNGLTPLTEYHYRLTSTDLDGNTAMTTDAVFMTGREPGAVLSDDFSGCQLDASIWTYYNPLGDATIMMTGEQVSISVPPGTGHDIWKSGINAPRIMQDIQNEDFEIEVKFDSVPTVKTQMHGILVQQDSGNFLRFNYQSNGNNNTAVIVDGKNGNAQSVFSEVLTGAIPAYLRVTRTGTTWTMQSSLNGQDWTTLTTINKALNTTQAGVFVGNTGGNPAYTGVIDYFFDTAAPINPEDGDSLKLDLAIVGNGTVTRNPEKAFYSCGEPVQLSATPAADWVFAGYSGDLVSTNPVSNVTMDTGKTITATFTNNTPYTLTVDVLSVGGDPGEDGGSYTVDPQQDIYNYGDEVTLTAIPDPGWAFTGWTGTLTSESPTETIIITGNTDIDATFTKEAYTVNIGIIHDGVGVGGTVTKKPDQATYEHGTPITLTAVAATGWSFGGWDGNIPTQQPLNPTASFTMTNSISATATFVQAQHSLVVNSVPTDGSGGTVTLDPPPNPTTGKYGYGQVVTLTAVPKPGWELTSWTGAVTGTELTKTLTITQDAAVTANFAIAQYEVNVTVNGNGSVTKVPDKAFYLYNDPLTLTAVPDSGYVFTGWSGDITATGSVIEIDVQSDLNITANFGVAPPIEVSDVDVSVLPGGTSAVVSWVTNVPGSSVVNYGLTDFYELPPVSDAVMVTNHSLVLTGLQADTLYYFVASSEDAAGNVGSSPEMTFITGETSGTVSDDFSACELNTSVWTFVNPLNDGSKVEITSDHQLALTVQGGIEHNVYPPTGGGQIIRAPHVRQGIENTDFVFEIKFDSPLGDVDTLTPMQGIIIGQDEDDLVRFDFFRNSGDQVTVYAATFEGGSPRRRNNDRITNLTAPIWMRVTREGNRWTQEYSFNGTNWTSGGSFNFALNANYVGIFAGNSGGNPAHTVLVDYFFDAGAPINPEESFYRMNVNVDGQGTVGRSPNRPGYACGDEVTLTANPAAGWQFAGWSGSGVSGSNRTLNLTVEQHYAITARFIEEGASTDFFLYMPVAVGSTND